MAGYLAASLGDASLERIKAHPVVFCLQDTTELDFKGKSTEGLGPLSYKAQRGMYLHPTDAVTPAREPLGALDAWMWSREFKAPKTGKRFGQRESVRWVEGDARIAEQATALPESRLVYVADREGDMVELMRLARDRDYPADWLIRSQHDRALGPGPWRTQTQSGTAGCPGVGVAPISYVSPTGQPARCCLPGHSGAAHERARWSARDDRGQRGAGQRGGSPRNGNTYTEKFIIDVSVMRDAIPDYEERNA